KCTVEVEGSLAGLVSGDPQIAGGRIHPGRLRILGAGCVACFLERLGGRLIVAPFLRLERAADQGLGSHDVGAGGCGGDGGGKDEDQDTGSSMLATVRRIASISCGSDSR